MSTGISEKDWDLYEILEPTTTWAKYEYTQLLKVMSTANSMTNGKPMGKHTRMFMDFNTGTIKIRYHDTDIITYFPNGGIHIQPYDSATTRRRLNEYLPQGVRIYRKNKVQYLALKLDDNLPEVHMEINDNFLSIGNAITWEAFAQTYMTE
mgnify:CR=1 FL=1